MWEETGVHPRVRMDDHITLSQTTADDSENLNASQVTTTLLGHLTYLVYLRFNILCECKCIDDGDMRFTHYNKQARVFLYETDRFFS